MTLSLHKSGASHPAVRIHVRKAGTTQPAQTAWLRSSGTIKEIFGSLALTLSRTSVLGRANSAGSITVQSGSVTATPNGAVGSGSYLWTRTAADAHPWTITNPTGATTAFQTSAQPGDDWTATFVCTFTDITGQSVTSPTVSVDCANNYFSTGGGGGGPYP